MHLPAGAVVGEPSRRAGMTTTTTGATGATDHIASGTRGLTGTIAGPANTMRVHEEVVAGANRTDPAASYRSVFFPKMRQSRT